MIVNDFKIFKADITNLKDILSIEQNCFKTPWSEKSISDMLNNENAHFFIIQDKESVGYIGGILSFDEVTVLNFAVLKDYRNKGFGSKILSYFLDYFIKKGAKKFFLEVRKSNKNAISIYEKNGFKIIDIRKNYYHSPTEDAIIYLKEV